MLKVGVGPSSSHTLGPWRAALAFVADLQFQGQLEAVRTIEVDLFGSLALTGPGHGTRLAITMGLCGADPESIPRDTMMALRREVEQTETLELGHTIAIPFHPARSIVMHPNESLPRHSNGMRFTARNEAGTVLRTEHIYSTGGGFIAYEDDESGWPAEEMSSDDVWTGREILNLCERDGHSLAEVARLSELGRMSDGDIDRYLDRITEVMIDATFRGCTSEGVLPGGLEVARRAPALSARLFGSPPASVESFLASLERPSSQFAETLKILSLIAVAVGEENASFGRVVTAPTNGSAGVIPAVLLYYAYGSGERRSQADLRAFLLAAALVGATFKAGATISAAAGGCQAEIGVSSAMAAAALTEGLGGTPAQSLMAAEIAMEHHLGLTCDPIGGLVQIPCIERNTMGAIKAVTSAHLALESDARLAKVSLDDVVKTMRETARDMDSRYKETSLGGLALRLPVSITEC
jgi:L-serine dehydratase